MAFATIAVSCKEEEKGPGRPVLEPTGSITSAHFADSIKFSAKVSDADGIALSTLKAKLYYNEDMVAETVIRTKTFGEYEGKIYAPFYADIPDGTATLQLVLQNINFTIVEQEFPVALSRPDYPSIKFISAGQEYVLPKTGKNQYAVTDNFAQKMEGYFLAPALGADGNDVTFGLDNGNIKEGTTSLITLSSQLPGSYEISFNTMTYEAAPMITVTINGTELQVVEGTDSSSAKIMAEKDQELKFEGFGDITTWTFDPPTLVSVADRVIFQGNSGEYEFVADFATKEITMTFVPPTDDRRVNGVVPQYIDQSTSGVKLTLAQNANVEFEDFEDFGSYWFNPSYFAGSGTGNVLRFRAIDGDYRILLVSTANYKYITVEALNSEGNPATLQGDGTGAIWIIGNGIGLPSWSLNQVEWNTGKALCMAPIGGKKYQIVVTGGPDADAPIGQTIKGSDINFKFFHQKDWGGEFNSTTLTTSSDIIFVGNGTNGRDNGNLGIADGKSLETGVSYSLTVDVSAGNDNAVLTVEKL